LKSYPLSPCGKRNPPHLKPPLWKFSVFCHSQIWKAERQKKKEKKAKQNLFESEFYDGRRFSKKFVEVVSWSAEQKVKEKNNKEQAGNNWFS
jgi:hypothetical protein